MNTASTSKQSSRQATAFPLRLPAELRKKLAEEAARNQRSLNGEIVYQLQNRAQGTA